jgi:hypothetical protein
MPHSVYLSAQPHPCLDVRFPSLRIEMDRSPGMGEFAGVKR